MGQCVTKYITGLVNVSRISHIVPNSYIVYIQASGFRRNSWRTWPDRAHCFWAVRFCAQCQTVKAGESAPCPLKERVRSSLVGERMAALDRELISGGSRAVLRPRKFMVRPALLAHHCAKGRPAVFRQNFLRSFSERDPLAGPVACGLALLA
jgi:hypothetical protein